MLSGGNLIVQFSFVVLILIWKVVLDLVFIKCVYNIEVNYFKYFLKIRT